MLEGCKIFCRTPIVQEITGVPEEGYAPFFFPVDGDVLLFKFTQDSFLRVLSSLANGAYMTYGTEGRQVVWDFLVNVEFPLPFCEQIIGCIENDPDVKQALRNFVMNDPEIQDYLSQKIQGLTTGLITGKLVPGVCDNSVVAGQVVQLVEKMNDINTDFFEIIEVGTNDEEKFAQVFEAIPVVDELPVGEVVDFAQSALEQLSENYAGAVTEGWKDAVEHDLYCIALKKPDCALTFKDVFEYFQTRATSGLTLGSLIGEVLDFIIDGDFNTDDRIASATYALQAASVLAGNKFAGMSVQNMGALMRDSLPSTKWEEWDDCDEPPPDPNCQSFLIDHENWEAFSYGAWSSGNGFESEFAVGLWRLYIHRMAWTGTAYKVVIKFSRAITNFYIANDNGSSPQYYTGDPVSSMEFSATTLPGTWTDRALNQGMSAGIIDGKDASFSILEMCIYLNE